MENLLSAFEKPQEEVIDEQKFLPLASKVAIWDHIGIPQAHYLALDKNEKSKMLNEYYNKLYLSISGMVRTAYFSVWILAFFFSILDPGMFLDGV